MSTLTLLENLRDTTPKDITRTLYELINILIDKLKKEVSTTGSPPASTRAGDEELFRIHTQAGNESKRELYHRWKDGIIAVAAHVRAEREGEFNKLVERSVGAMAIAEGDEGWENIPLDCPMLKAVAQLRTAHDLLSDHSRRESKTIKEVLQHPTPSTLEQRANELDVLFYEMMNNHTLVKGDIEQLENKAWIAVAHRASTWTTSDVQLPTREREELAKWLAHLIYPDIGPCDWKKESGFHHAADALLAPPTHQPTPVREPTKEEVMNKYNELSNRSTTFNDDAYELVLHFLHQSQAPKEPSC